MNPRNNFIGTILRRLLHVSSQEVRVPAKRARLDRSIRGLHAQHRVSLSGQPSSPSKSGSKAFYPS